MVLQNYRYSFIDLLSSVLQIFMEKSGIFFCLESGNPVVILALERATSSLDSLAMSLI
jgi:hypothetical protein